MSDRHRELTHEPGRECPECGDWTTDEHCCACPFFNDTATAEIYTLWEKAGKEGE
jgi:hypothetical protein